MSRSPPLRFLLLLLAGWTGSRAAWLAPGWRPAPAEAGGAARTGGFRPEAAVPSKAAEPIARPPVRTAAAEAPPASLRRLAPAPGALPPASAARLPSEEPLWPVLPWQLPAKDPIDRRRPVPSPGGAEPSPGSAPSRWSFAAWSVLRRGGAATLVPAGTLGGSQAGLLARFRLNGDPARPLALAIRLSSPLERPAGAEAAVGIDWQPSRRVPVHLLAERRQGIGREGRSAFGLTLHGGVSDSRFGGLRVEAYAQAGIVGTRSRDLFGDGALRLSVPLGRVRLGAGAWAAAQPGAARLDLGPQALLRLPVTGRNVAIAADWRFRAAGHARPGSGPALMIASDF
ncbi:MAG TPA: hypothetical protein VF605_11905 [Allosphingosinicella sp.]|jgi:hypothetical protein